MSIEVRVPEEISDYKESIVAGLSVRQLVCSGIALLCGVPTFFLLKNINMDLATYATMIVVVPAFCIGFIKKDGYTFEVYTKIRVRNFFSKAKRGYETNPEENSLPIEAEKCRAKIQQQIKESLQKQADEKSTDKKKRGEKIALRKQKAKPKGSFKGAAKTEYDLAEVTKKSAERKRKSTYKKLKAPTGGYRKEERKKEKAD